MVSSIDPALIPPAPSLEFEQQLWQAGIPLTAGIDEAGRGALAGPVAAAAVILTDQPGMAEALAGVRDSKQMSRSQRETARPRIQAAALAYAVGFATAQEVDQLGILPATRLAASRAVQALPAAPAHLLLDCLFLPDLPIPQTSLVKGDRRSLSIAAASVLAKTARDDLMDLFDGQYPAYRFAAHKGYGTLAHRLALRQHGPCPIHRLTFRHTLFGETA